MDRGSGGEGGSDARGTPRVRSVSVQLKVRDSLIMFPLDRNSRSSNEIYGNVPSRLPVSPIEEEEEEEEEGKGGPMCSPCTAMELNSRTQSAGNP